MESQADRLIWIDLEMTGLDTQQDSIIEIATVVTDKDLEVVAEGPVLAIHQPQDVMARMDEWNTRQHGKSGLTVPEFDAGMPDTPPRPDAPLPDVPIPPDVPFIPPDVCIELPPREPPEFVDVSFISRVSTADVYFLVDVTGSMGDEISYLQKEFDAFAATIQGQLGAHTRHPEVDRSRRSRNPWQSGASHAWGL